MRFLFLIITTHLIFAGHVTVDVDSHQISEGESIILTVKSQNSKDAPIVSLPNFTDFTIVSGPTQSSNSSYSLINGKMASNSSYTLTWTLMPRKIGRLLISSFQIQLDGKTTKSKPIYVGVEKRSKNSKKTAQFFVEAKIDNVSPYRGEQVILTYTLYTRVDITSFDEKMPRYKGFWVEDLFSPTKLQLRKVQKNRLQYHAATIKKSALFPTKSGKITIDPMIATIGVRDGKRNSFSVFGSPSKQHTISTESIILNVKPLPKTKDGQTSAVVGKWNIKSTIHRTNVMQDEALTIKVHLTGNGNLKSADILPYKFPESFEVFEPKVTVKNSKSQSKIGGEKIIEYVVIPRTVGKVTLSPFEIKYFDNAINKWNTKRSKAIKLSVVENKKSTSGTVGLSKEEVQLVGKDIRFMDDGEPHWQKTNSGLVDKNILILATVALILFFFPSVVNMRQSHLKNTMGDRKSRRALKESVAMIKTINDSPVAVYGSIHQAIIMYINSKTGQKSAEYSSGNIISIFEMHSLSSTSMDSLKKIMERGEAVRYSPVSAAEIQNDIEGIKAVLKEADNGWA
ncbi:MAG: protein BatD [Candidatus Marinimicrobia bacterium]|nr:protein BatD [Candidatus Neomarinimicrobiota bacterium]